MNIGAAESIWIPLLGLMTLAFGRDLDGSQMHE